MKQLFEYAVLLNEKKDTKGNITEKAEILVEPTYVLADDVSQATLLAGRAVPEDHLEHLERVTLAVRPF